MKEKIISLLKKETKLLEKEIENLIEIPPSKELGDYSFPCFILSKKFKQPPQKIAEDLAKKIRDDSFEKIESKGPYINFFINRKEIAKTILEQVQKKDFGKKNLKQKRETRKRVMHQKNVCPHQQRLMKKKLVILQKRQN